MAIWIVIGVLYLIATSWFSICALSEMYNRYWGSWTKLMADKTDNRGVYLFETFIIAVLYAVWPATFLINFILVSYRCIKNQEEEE